jgi:predicted RNase H-like nuclease (RuvC/YqgF family)
METVSVAKRIEMLERLTEEVRACREMLKSELESNPQYVEAFEEAKEVVSKKKRIKDEILSTGPNQKLVSEMKDNLEEISTLKEILNQELIDLWEKEKTDEIADPSGGTRKFVVTVKLMPKKGYNQH